MADAESVQRERELAELRARIAAEHLGDADRAALLRNRTEDGLRREAERLRAEYGPRMGLPVSGSLSPEAEFWRARQRRLAQRERLWPEAAS
jgi:hypothetical protein